MVLVTVEVLASGWCVGVGAGLVSGLACVGVGVGVGLVLVL